MHRRFRQRPSEIEEKGFFRGMISIIKGFTSRLIYIYKLVWQATPLLLIALMAICVLEGVLPVLGAYISRDLLNEIAKLIELHASTSAIADAFEFLSPLIFLFVLEMIYLFARKVLGKVKTMVTGIAGELVTNHIKLMIIGKSKEVDLSSFDNPDFYEKLENANREASMRPIGILTASFNVISAIISAVSFVAVLATLHPIAPILIVVSAVPGAIVNFAYRNKNFRYIRFHSKERRQMNYYSNLMVNKDRAKEIKILGLGDTFIDNYKNVFAKYYKGLKNLIIKEGIISILIGLISTVVSSALFIYVAYTVIFGNGMVGDYSLYSGALSSVASYVTTLLTSTVTIYEGTLFIDNMITFMNEEPRIVPDSTTPIIPQRGIEHTIVFENVSFRYPGMEDYVIKNINLTLNHGESVVLVGLNGAGKTTLIKLITRLYDPTEGRILLDGRDLREYDPAALYDLFGIIFQDFGHYSETAAENIRMGDVDRPANPEEIELAAVRSGAYKFIETMPDKFDTPLTRVFEENGAELSGGQWQKLSIARAFYKESDILILDEPTSALDPLAEREIFDQYTALAKGKISVFVSHKLSSAVTADKIVVLENGQIAEMGSHEELMNKKGRYFNLFSVQAERYAGVEYT